MAYIEGLKDQGILKGDGNATPSGPSGTGNPGLPIDLTGDAPPPPGFTTRRAG